MDPSPSTRRCLRITPRQVQCVVLYMLALISLDMGSYREYRRMALLITTKGSLVLITTCMYLTNTGMGERVSTTNRGQYSPNMGGVPPSSLMVFYTSMNLTCTGLGVTVPASSRDLSCP